MTAANDNHLPVPDNLADALGRIANLEIALVSNRRIGMAIGIIMAIRKITEEAAFAALARQSQQTHRKLHLVAEDVVNTGWLEQHPASSKPRQRVLNPVEHRG